MNYCTLFDSHYMTRGLAMYESLKAHSRDFHLYIFAFDQRSHALLKKLNLDCVTVISLEEFADDDLLRVKKQRTPTEYCWTCTPSIIAYAIQHYHLDRCTYVDADLYFFADPSVAFDGMGENSILLTEHRYTPRYERSIQRGIYCVQFMTFKNDLHGMAALNWWRTACIDWCYARCQHGKFGDQKYLDDWTMRFQGVHVLQHPGTGLAPWNIQQYDWDHPAAKIIFYHFHQVWFLQAGKVDLGGYQLRARDIDMLYKPYLRHVMRIGQRLREIEDDYDYHGIRQRHGVEDFFRTLVRKIQRRSNVYTITDLTGE